MSFDPVAIIEEAHRLATEADDAVAWLERVARLVLPAMSPSWLGGLAVLAEPPPPEPLVIPIRRASLPRERRVAALDARALNAVLVATLTSAGQDHRAAASDAVRRPGLTSLMEAAGSLPPWTDTASPLPIGDVIVLSVPGLDGRLTLFAAVTPERVRTDDVTKRLWHRLAVHLGDALSRVGATMPSPGLDAAITLDTTAEHALRDAVRDVSRVRPTDPTGALELLRGLLTGRWSLVDHFDEDGRRYVLAQQNPKGDRATRLSRRQRQVAFHAAVGCSNKEIGFALGLAENTVSAHLGRAMEKMGVTARTELVRLATQVTVGAERRVA